MHSTAWPAILLAALLAFGPAASFAATRQVDRTAAETAAQLTALSPRVSYAEARQLAALAHATSYQLRRDYRLLGSPHFDNFLVNAGVMKRGLCHHWARDLGERLAPLKLRTLQLRWGIARRGTLREHSSVVVTARGQPFARGVVLDPWRHSGRLFAGPVSGDKYPWEEDRSETFVSARGR